MAEYADVGVKLKPELLKAIHFILKEQCNLQDGWRVVLISDSHTPLHVTTAFLGVAMQLGAEAVMELKVPMAPHPVYQPGYTWDALIADSVRSAAQHADLLIDMTIGYADFMVDVVKAGKAKVIGPGDGTGAPHIDDSLIRCLLLDDPFRIRREALAVAQIMSGGKTLHVTSAEGTDYRLDIADLRGDSFDGFLWDRESGKWVS